MPLKTANTKNYNTLFTNCVFSNDVIPNHFVFIAAIADQCHNPHIKMDTMKNLIVNKS